MKKAFLLLLITLTIGAAAQTGAQKIFDSLTKVYEANGFHGVILVAKGDKVLYEKGYGLANFEQKIANTPSTVFKTESVGKMFTAVSILQLVETGKLKLTQTVKELLPELNVKNADKITVHHLLNHTSGLQSPWDHPQWQFKKDYTHAEMVKIVEEVPLSFDTPGQRMFYSNSGYVVLSWIVEKITGKPFDQWYQEHIFSPLQMTSTRHLLDTVMPVKTGAQPYRILSSKRFILMDETLGPKASGAGGWVSTAHDLYWFMLGLYQNKLVKPETWELMRTANGNAPTDSVYRYYAYGLETYVNQLIPGVKLYGHNGGGAGFSIDAFVDPATGYIVTSCTNLYQNSRPIVVNYLKAALGKQPDAVQPMVWVKVYDAINEKGIDAFVAGGKENLQSLNVQLHPGMFAQVADALNAAKDYHTLVKWMDFALSLYPDETFLMILKGDSQVSLGNKEAAKSIYLQAKEISTKRNEQWFLPMLDGKLKTL
jgi:CubicO group peptidase (beta-lactamase class C family)